MTPQDNQIPVYPVNTSEIEAFLDFLEPRIDRVTVTWLEPLRGVATVLKSEVAMLAATTQRPSTAHVTLNRTDLLGNKKKNITEARVFAVDLDQGTEQEDLLCLSSRYAPHWINESSPGKFHLFWRCAPEFSLQEWSEIQTALAYGFGGDYAFRNITQPVRVPGIPRVTKSGEIFTPFTVVYSKDHEPLDRTALEELFPDLFDWYEKGKNELKAANKALKQAMKEVRKMREYGKFAKDVDPGLLGRNVAIYTTVKDALTNIAYDQRSFESCLELAHEANKAFSTGPLDDQELESAVAHAYERGLWIREQRLSRLSEMQHKSLELLKNFGVPKHTNGHAVHAESVTVDTGSIHDWNYDDGRIVVHPFSEYAMVDRVVKLYDKELIKVKNQMYAFNPESRCWREQSRGGCSELTDAYAKVCTEFVNTTEFIEEFATTAEGEVSSSKLITAQHKFLSHRAVSSGTSAIFNHIGVRRTEQYPFDSAPNLLLCANGVLNMENGELREASGEDYLIATSGVSWVRGTGCPGWLEFLRQIFAESTDVEAMVSFIQDLFGYSLGTSIGAQKVFCHVGDGSNGKSKLLSALGAITGNYSTIIDPDDMMKGNGFGLRFERIGAKFEGKRVVIVDDMDTSCVWNEAFVKNLTAPTIRARGEYEKSRVVPNRAKVHIGLNSIPRPESENYGLLRRLCIIPYNRRFNPNGDESMAIDEMIQNEVSGILCWAVEGWKRIHGGRGLVYPQDTVLAEEDYRQENFTLESAIGELFEVDLGWGSGMQPKDALSHVQAFLGGTPGVSKITATSFGLKLGAILGVKVAIKKVAGKSTRIWPIRLKRLNSSGTENL